MESRRATVFPIEKLEIDVAFNLDADKFVNPLSLYTRVNIC